MMEYDIDEVESVEMISEEYQDVYDIGMVDTPHTFFANGILVHNSCYVAVDRILKSFNYPHHDNIEKCSEFIDKNISKLLTAIIDKAMKRLALQEMNCPECKITFKREMITRRMIFLAKKRYVAWVIIGEDGPVKPGSDHEIEVKGLEAVRSTTPGLIREKLFEFYEEFIKTLDRKHINEKVKVVYNELIKSEPEVIAKISTANNLEEYTDITGEPKLGTPQHVKGSILYNKMLKKTGLDKENEIIFEGDKVMVVYINGCKKFPDFRETSIAFKNKLPKDLGFEIDYETICSKNFLEPITSFYDLMKWQVPPMDAEDIEDMFG